jgi:Fur family transcriptional regulator, ferric uptake regulator
MQLIGLEGRAHALGSGREMESMANLGLGQPRGGIRGRKTSQRAAVLDSLRASGRFRTAQDIYSELRSDGARIGLTTVYRHLQKLVDDGTIHTVQAADRQMRYRLCGDAPHHHLVCTNCGIGVEIIDTELDRWVESEGVRRGYSGLTLRMEIFGVCPSCRGGTDAA